MNVLFIDSTHPRLPEMLSKAGFICDYLVNLKKDETLAIIDKYEGIIIRSKFKIDSDVIDKAHNLKFIGRVGSGLENIDTEYAKQKGITCFNSPEGNRDAVGEHALGLLLTLANNISKADSEIRNGKWAREENRGIELKGKTIGIIGYGNMGSAFAQRLRGFESHVIAYDKYKFNYSNDFVTEKTLADLFEQADILSLHVPLTDETNYMVNNDFINRFKKPIYIINTSRGKVINTNDLVVNIKNGKVLGAALDVIEYEEVSFENLLSAKPIPEAFDYLLKCNKVVLTPHIAGWTIESNIKLSEVLAQKIINQFAK